MKIASYVNGNYSVVLHHDGTKVRSYDDAPKPLFPESIDLCVTKHCDLGCSWCHECATLNGQHAALNDVIECVYGLPPGVEVAIGGGDPMSHPQIGAILGHFRDAGLIANMTVNGSHLWKYDGVLQHYQRHGLLYGIGVSWNGQCTYDARNLENVVYHMIAGVHQVQDAFQSSIGRLLVLGYKQYGRGKELYNDGIKNNIGEWRYWLPRLLRQNMIVSFDNLALEQLNVRKVVGEDKWRQHYMGEDGQFTMYIDAVNMQFAKSSVSERIPIDRRSVPEMFSVVRGEA